jgi:hypothetical protein
MIATLDDVEFETRMIGPLVLTTPVLRQLGLTEIIDRFCPVAGQADMVSAATQSDPRLARMDG